MLAGFPSGPSIGELSDFNTDLSAFDDPSHLGHGGRLGIASGSCFACILVKLFKHCVPRFGTVA